MIKSHYRVADDMMKMAAKITNEVMSQREEILRAFVAKYGFHPDEAQQIHQGNKWFVVRIHPEVVKRVQREVVLARLSRERFTIWQRFCLWLAGL